MKGDARSLDYSSEGGPIGLYTLQSFQLYVDFEFGVVWSRGFGGINPEVATLEPLVGPEHSRWKMSPQTVNPQP